MDLAATLEEAVGQTGAKDLQLRETENRPSHDPRGPAWHGRKDQNGLGPAGMRGSLGNRQSMKFIGSMVRTISSF